MLNEEWGLGIASRVSRSRVRKNGTIIDIANKKTIRNTITQ